jgi:predicted DNA-binding protein YlxM (UPF0122 family)
MLIKIKIKALSKGLKMQDIAKGIGVSRQHMYRSIQKNDTKLLKRIEEFLNHML